MTESAFTLQETYNRSLSSIKFYTGLKDLSLIEKVALRDIAREALERVTAVEHPFNDFSPMNEATAIFLEQFYGIQAKSQEDVDFLVEMRISVYKQNGYDAWAEYFKMKQDEMHMP